MEIESTVAEAQFSNHAIVRKFIKGWFTWPLNANQTLEKDLKQYVDHFIANTQVNVDYTRGIASSSLVFTLTDQQWLIAELAS